MRVEYHPAVEAELRAIQDYYEERSPGLRGEFIDEFERQVLQLAARPERWMVIAGDLRRCLMRRFPYIIYFRWVDSERVRITVVKHQRRHPDYGVNENRPNQAAAVDAPIVLVLLPVPFWRRATAQRR
jgi:plasmid stabilization system protein ParE